MGLWILRIYERCSGCRLCEIACSIRHEGRIWPEASRIRVFEFAPAIDVPHLCSQCGDYPCVKACPTQALLIDKETGAVLVDEGKCVLCGECIKACPGRVPRIVAGKDSVVICDLCGGEPECVKVCEQAGFNALKLVKRPDEPVPKAYSREPTEVAKDLIRKYFSYGSVFEGGV